MPYSIAFEKAIHHLMLYEIGGFWKLTPDVEAGLISTIAQQRACGYTNDPVDPGGETKFGIAKNANPNIDVKHLNWEGAKAIYYSHYWLNGKCDKMPARLATLMFDGNVNNGVGTANKMLQRSLVVVDDGVIGPTTLEKIAAENEIELCNKVCNQREQYYHDIVSRKPTQVKYLAGWLRRISEMRAFVINPAISFT